MTQTCRCCGKTGEGKAGTVKDNVPPGWGVALDQGNGLETVFYCPGCSDEIRRLADWIMVLVKCKDVYFQSLLKLPKRGEP